MSCDFFLPEDGFGHTTLSLRRAKGCELDPEKASQ